MSEFSQKPEDLKRASGSCRIAFVLQDTGTVYGAERATLDLAYGLHFYTGIAPTFVLIQETRLGLRKSSIVEELKTAGIEYSSVSTGHAFSLQLVRRLRLAFGTCGADCVHAIGYKAVFHCALASLIPGVRPWVSTVHGWLERRNLKERLYKKLEIRALKRANKVIALSNYYFDLLTGFGFSRDRLQLIPSGLHLNGWTPRKERACDAADRRQICIGILGRLSDEKNHEMFLRVAERLLQEELPVRFLIAGDGPLKAPLAQLIESKMLGKHVAMPGIMDRDAFFGQCDILVNCSRIENLPYSILEAMECSLPVVSTAVGGIPDLIVEGKTGNLVAVDDDEAMVTGLTQLIRDPDRARAFGCAAHQRVKEGFSLAESAMRHGELYCDLVSQKSRGR